MCAQAFKRACVAFGVGRYLYTHLPQVWGDLNGKYFKDPRRLVHEMYEKAKLREWQTLYSPNRPVKSADSSKVSEFMQGGAKVTAQEVATQAGLTTADQLPPVDNVKIANFKALATRCENLEDLKLLAEHMKLEKEKGALDAGTLAACRMVWQRRHVELSPPTIDVAG
jgi:hypothetical protein